MVNNAETQGFGSSMADLEFVLWKYLPFNKYFGDADLILGEETSLIGAELIGESHCLTCLSVSN